MRHGQLPGGEACTRACAGECWHGLGLLKVFRRFWHSLARAFLRALSGAGTQGGYTRLYGTVASRLRVVLRTIDGQSRSST